METANYTQIYIYLLQIQNSIYVRRSTINNR
jgi:hypothetical protein